VDLTDVFTPRASLASLALAAFLAATLVPLSSEAALFGVLKLHPDLFWPALAVATAGNTLGGLTTYLIGRFVAMRKPLERAATVRRWGAPALAFAWAPIVGDALSLAAGWLKVNWMSATLFSAVGRLVRYWVIAQGALW
jgi:membrane protein YqaA with SNARE-associated domain